MSKIEHLSSLLERHTPQDGMHACALPGVTLIRSSAPTMPMPSIYTPSVCLVTQGRKRASLGERTFVYGAGDYLVASVDLPMVGTVIEASAAAPYLCLQIDLDIAALSELALAHPHPGSPAQPGTGLMINDVTDALADAFGCLLSLLDTPGDIAALAPLAAREILYRLLTGPAADMMRHIALADGSLVRISRAIAWIKDHYDQPLSIERLAAEAAMSTSALHAHFKAVTTMSPLQYRAQLRLQEARRLMVSEGADAAQAGFRVGYESPSQFSREYRRCFGAAPASDAGKLRASGGRMAA